MKRNLAVIRDVLLHVERNVPFTGKLQQLRLGDIESACTREEVAYAVYLAIDHRLLDGVWDSRNPAVDGPLVRAITDEGYEALESVRDEAVWKTMARALQKTEIESRSIAVLKKIAEQLVEERVSSAVGLGAGQTRHAAAE